MRPDRKGRDGSVKIWYGNQRLSVDLYGPTAIS
jgi:hypothetical protein